MASYNARIAALQQHYIVRATENDTYIHLRVVQREPFDVVTYDDNGEEVSRETVTFPAPKTTATFDGIIAAPTDPTRPDADYADRYARAYADALDALEAALA